MTCTICERRPAREGGYCAQCQSNLDAERKRKKGQSPAKFLTYRGHVVGLFPNGKDKFTTRLLNRDPKGLPKTKTLDLNQYLDGFTREQIKKMKRCVLQLASA